MGTIRFAAIADAPALLAIYTPYVEKTSISFEYTAPSLTEFEGRIREIISEYPYIVYQEGDAILGYAYGHRAMERAAYGWNAELSVYVDRGYIGRGIGSRLYRCLMDLLQLQGVRNVYGVVTHPNPPSEALHRRLGFQLTARFPAAGYKQGRWRDVLWFGKVLSAGPPQPLRPIGAVDGEAVLRRYNQ